MHREGNARLSDADLLHSAWPPAQSDSASIISVLAFEVLLKCVHFAENGSTRPVGLRDGHDYISIWQSLSEATRERIILAAEERITGAVKMAQIEIVLNDFANVFKRARYYYELYEGKTLREQAEEGEDWLKRGANLDEARIRYRPQELTCLVHALNAEISRHLEE